VFKIVIDKKVVSVLVPFFVRFIETGRPRKQQKEEDGGKSQQQWQLE
jgi:hypothetical protein